MRSTSGRLPEVIWEALTTPEWSTRYGYRVPTEYDLKPGGKYRAKATHQMLAIGLPEVVIDGEVIEHTHHAAGTDVSLPVHRGEQGGGIYPRHVGNRADDGGILQTHVTHDMEGAPLMASATASKFDQQGGGGWTWIISDLKSLLETGKSLSG